MSSFTRRCPACCRYGPVSDLPEETLRSLLLDQGGVMPPKDPGWKYAAFWCARCETPFIESYPLASLETRRELVGLPRDLLVVDDEGDQA